MHAIVSTIRSSKVSSRALLAATRKIYKDGPDCGGDGRARSMAIANGAVKKIDARWAPTRKSLLQDSVDEEVE